MFQFKYDIGVDLLVSNDTHVIPSQELKIKNAAKYIWYVDFQKRTFSQMSKIEFVTSKLSLR